MWPPGRRLRIAGGSIVAVVVFAALVAPVVLRGNGGSCSETLLYEGRTYTARDVGGAPVVQAIAVGVGVLSGCGARPQNADVRSIVGLRPALAVGLPTETTTLFVARGWCPSLTGASLLRCLHG